MRKVTAACLLLLALCLGARAEAEKEAYVVSTDDGMPMVVGRDGALIYPGGQFTSIYDLLYAGEGTQLFAVSDGKHTVADEYGYESALEALADANGNILTDMRYSLWTYCTGSDSVIFARDGLMGALDAQGNELFSGPYEQLTGIGGGFLAMKGGELVAIDRAGTEADTGIACEGFFVSGNRACATGVDGVTRILDERGATVAQLAEGQNIGYSTGPYFVVYGQGDAFLSPVGLLDRDGREVLPMVYSSISLYEGIPGAPIVAEAAGGAALFDAVTLENTGFIPMQENAWISSPGGNRLVVFNPDGAGQVYDYQGNFIGTLAEGASLYGNAMFSDGKEAVFGLSQYNGGGESTCYLVDAQLNRVGEEAYRQISFVSWQAGQGRYIVTNYDTVPMDGYEAYVPGSMRNALIDEAGNALLPMEYESMTALAPDRYWVKRADEWGLTDDAGHWYYRQSAYTELMD